MPEKEILKKYQELGGTLITLGSDDHKAKYAEFGLKIAANAVKTLGFNQIYYYKNRISYPLVI